MSRLDARHVALLMLAVLALLLAGCAAQRMPIYWVDATRGCNEEIHDVELWSAPGAVPAGAEIVGAIPHKAQFQPSEIVTAFGVRYYRVSWDGDTGWLAGNYVKTYEPICN